MNALEHKKARLARRKHHIRHRLMGTPERPRLTVFRSHRNITAQLIDDISGRTLCSAGTNTKAVEGQVKYGGNCQAAEMIGKLLAEQARMHGIRQVAFDRNGRRFHGRIKALAEAARKSGLEF